MILTNDNYYSLEANQEYMSVSQFKAFCKCEAAALAEVRGEYKRPVTTAMLIGSYVDAWAEGTLSMLNFEDDHPELFTKRGELRREFFHATKMMNRIQRDPLFMEYLQGDKQAIFTSELFGAKWKAKLDVYKKGERIVDLKTSRSLQRVMGKSLVENFEYDKQGAVYQFLEGNGLPFFLAIVTKEEEPDIEIVEIEQPELNEAMRDIERKMPRILAVKNGEAEPMRCGVCEYCRKTKKLTSPISSLELGFSNYELMAMKGAEY